MRRLCFWLLASVVAITAIAPAIAAAHDKKRPLVIGHRGAAGYLPDHTLQGYQLAIDLGADYIEPDLVSTKDGVLIARHEPNMIATTDVASHPEFASKRRMVSIDGGAPEEGFFASDFTLRQIKTLHAVQPFAERPHKFDGKFEIPTFEEILDLRERESAKRGRIIGVYPETKHPSFHLELNLPLEERLLDALRKRKLDRPDGPVFIQSFESANLQYLHTKTQLPLVQLLDDGALLYDAAGKRVVGVKIPQYGDKRGRAAPQSLEDVAKYANAIGPWKRQIMRDVGGQQLLQTTLIEQAHAAGLRVHTYTFRSEPATLAPEYHGDPQLEYQQFYALGIDGVFSDFADVALSARK